MSAHPIRLQDMGARTMASLAFGVFCGLVLLSGASAGGKGWWRPPQRVQWQLQLDNSFNITTDLLTDTATDNVTVYTVDLKETSAQQIHKLRRAGKHVVCYFQAGTWAPYTIYSHEILGASECLNGTCDCGNEVCGALGLRLENGTEDLWVNVSDSSVRKVMRKILNMAAEKQCNAVQPDNVNGFERDSYCTGFEQCETCTQPDEDWNAMDVCAADFDAWLDFNRWLAREAHCRGMGIAMSSNKYQADLLSRSHDFVIADSCLEFDECRPYAPFSNRGKAVLDVEYDLDVQTTCSKAQRLASSVAISAMVKSYNLTATDRQSCCGAVPCAPQ